MIFAAGSGAPARMTPSVSQSAVAARDRAAAGGSAAVTNSAILVTAMANSLRRKKVEESCSPPWLRRGGRDLKKNIAQPPCWERTGWLVQTTDYRWLEPTTLDA